jgi:hypothetical protein
MNFDHQLQDAIWREYWAQRVDRSHQRHLDDYAIYRMQFERTYPPHPDTVQFRNKLHLENRPYKVR